MSLPFLEKQYPSDKATKDISFQLILHLPK